MITKLIIVSHIWYNRHLYESFYESCSCLKEAWGCTPSTPYGMQCHRSTNKFSNSGNVAAGKGYDHVPPSQINPRVVDRRWIRTLKASQGVWHDQLSLSNCRYAGIVFLEKKIVSNRLINWQDMWMKTFIHIALACKWPTNYYAN